MKDKIMSYLTVVWNFVRKVYSLPGIAQVLDRAVIEYLRGRALSTKNKVDDKLVLVAEAALNNKNYRAVMNGKAKKA
jgi:hypothetical protein